MNGSLRHLLLPGAAFAVSIVLLIATVSVAAAEDAGNDLSSRIADQQLSLEQTWQQIAGLDQQIQQQEQALDTQRTELADATTLLSEAEDRYQASLGLFSDRITAIYKMGIERYYEVLLTSDGFSDMLARLYYLGLISEKDRDQMDSMKSQAEQVRAIRARVDTIKQAQAGTVDELNSRRQDLATQAATGQALLAADNAELDRMRQQERDAAALRQVQAASFQTPDFALYSGVMGPSIQLGDGPPEGLQPTGIIISGDASWYGPGFNGHTTANGEIYNMYGVSAAHKTLPFGTWLRVTYNGRSIFVRINDRGPYIGGRILDLSAAAAQAVGLNGVGAVTAEIYR